MEYSLDINENHVLITFSSKQKILSSSVFNGGFVKANNVLILKVDDTSETKTYEPPQITLEKYCDKLKLNGTTIGLMTAAKMNSFRKSELKEKEITVECLLTCGLTNAKCAGDEAEWKHFYSENYKPGTINIIIITNACLSDSTLVESIMTVTEAKASVLNELKIKSTVSDKIATGTGTDAIVIVNGSNNKIDYAGKHVLFGEMLGKATRKALFESIKNI